MIRIFVTEITNGITITLLKWCLRQEICYRDVYQAGLVPFFVILFVRSVTLFCLCVMLYPNRAFSVHFHYVFEGVVIALCICLIARALDV